MRINKFILFTIFILLEFLFVCIYEPYTYNLINEANYNSKLIDKLSDEISLYSSNEFKGRAVSVFINEKNNSSWGDNYLGDINRINIFKNDYRGIGLWKYGIPTLFEYNQLNNSLLHYYVKKYLTNVSDSSEKNILNITKVDIEALRILGVTHLITNNYINDSRVNLEYSHENSSSKLFLYKIQNLTLYSNKINLHHGFFITDSFVNIIDPNEKIIKTTMTNKYFENPNYAKLLVKNNGFSVMSSSPGESLLVLPIQFSNCLTSSNKNIKLLRINVLMTGLIFKGDIDDSINFSIGVFNNLDCKKQDYLDTLNILEEFSF